MKKCALSIKLCCMAVMLLPSLSFAQSDWGTGAPNVKSYYYSMLNSRHKVSVAAISNPPGTTDEDEKFVVAYADTSKHVDVQYYNPGTSSWVILDDVINVSDVTSYTYASLTSVSIITYPDTTTNDDHLCVAIAVKADDELLFSYATFKLEHTGTSTWLTTTDTESAKIISDIKVDTEENAMLWYDWEAEGTMYEGDHCDSSVPAGEDTYADGDRDEFTKEVGTIHASYNGTTPYFACAVGGFVDHYPENSNGYLYEEHSALYVVDGTDTFFKLIYETCETVNNDAPSITTTRVNFTTNPDSADDTIWIVGYVEPEYSGGDDDNSAGYKVTDYITTDNTTPFSDAFGTPFGLIWDDEPYAAYMYKDTAPSPDKYMIKIESVDSSPSSTGTIETNGPTSVKHIYYVGQSLDTDDIHIITGKKDQEARLYSFNKSVNTSAFDETDGTEVRAIEYGSLFYGDRIAVKPDGNCVIIIGQGDEYRGDIDYELEVAVE